MSMPSDDAQRELERRALRKVRGLVDMIERTDEVDSKAQKRLLAAILIGAILVALAIVVVIAAGGERPKPVVIDASKLPPVRAGPPR